jgi:8-oxo-dGTP diphosphatase
MPKTLKNKDLKFAIIATDVAIFTIQGDSLKVLLIPVNIPPFFNNMKGLPCGLVTPSETAEDSVFRHIKNKTGLEVSFIEQLQAFSAIDRDPRGRVVSIAYTALISEDDTKKSSLKDNATWVNVSSLPKLAYDHNEIIKTAIENIRSKLWYTKIFQYLLPTKFTLSEMQSAFEIVLKKKFDKRNFRKKIVSLDVIKKIPGKKMEGAHRPAELYSFKK